MKITIINTEKSEKRYAREELDTNGETATRLRQLSSVIWRSMAALSLKMQVVSSVISLSCHLLSPPTQKYMMVSG